MMCLMGGLIQNDAFHGDGIGQRHPKIGFEPEAFQLDMLLAVFARNTLHDVNVLHLG